MIEHLLQWMPLAAAVGFILGEAYSDLRRHRKRYQDATDQLCETLREAETFTDSIHRALKQQRGVINDIHKRVAALAEALERSPSK